MAARYEAVEIDGRWFIIDHRHPLDPPHEAPNEESARQTARVWNVLVY